MRACPWPSISQFPHSIQSLIEYRRNVRSTKGAQRGDSSHGYSRSSLVKPTRVRRRPSAPGQGEYGETERKGRGRNGKERKEGDERRIRNRYWLHYRLQRTTKERLTRPMNMVAIYDPLSGTASLYLNHTRIHSVPHCRHRVQDRVPDSEN